jgi:hypothetical protein
VQEIHGPLGDFMPSPLYVPSPYMAPAEGSGPMLLPFPRLAPPDTGPNAVPGKDDPELGPAPRPQPRPSPPVSQPPLLQPSLLQPQPPLPKSQFGPASVRSLPVSEMTRRGHSEDVRQHEIIAVEEALP